MKVDIYEANKDHVDLQCSMDEVRTLYFALRHYSDAIEADIKKASEKGAEGFEDKMFLGLTLNQINSVLFDLLGNHTPEFKAELRKRLDVI